MQKVKILKTWRYSPDCRTTITYKNGCEYEVSTDVIEKMMADGACEIIEQKAVEVAPENKAIKTLKKKRKK